MDREITRKDFLTAAVGAATVGAAAVMAPTTVAFANPEEAAVDQSEETIAYSEELSMHEQVIEEHAEEVLAVQADINDPDPIYFTSEQGIQLVSYAGQLRNHGAITMGERAVYIGVGDGVNDLNVYGGGYIGLDR